MDTTTSVLHNTQAPTSSHLSLITQFMASRPVTHALDIMLWVRRNSNAEKSTPVTSVTSYFAFDLTMSMHIKKYKI